MSPRIQFLTFVGENPKAYYDIMSEVFEESPFRIINFEVAKSSNANTVLQTGDYERTDELFILMAARNNHPVCNGKVYREWGSPKMPKTLFGEQYQRDGDFYSNFTGQEAISSSNCDETIKYIDDSEGTHIGIFCYPNMCSLFYGTTLFADELELNIFKKTMQQLQAMLPKSKEELDHYTEIIEQNKNIAVIKEIFQQELSTKEREFRDVESSITVTRNNLRELIMTRTNIMWQIDALKENLDHDIKSMFDEIENMKRMHAVKKVSFNRDTRSLLVFTDMIYIPKNKNQSYKIGEFKITIPIARPLDIKFENLIEDLRRHSCWGPHCHHPHVSESGSACFGNAEDTLAELSAQKEWCTFVSFLISYLESVNTADPAGKNVWRWPLVNMVDGCEVKQRTVECSVCGEVINVDDGEVAYTCDRCGNENVCKNCIIANGNGTNWCVSCYDDYRRTCVDCGATILIEPDQDYSEYTCDRCGEYVCNNCAVIVETLSSGETERLCQNCHEIRSRVSRTSSPTELVEVENDPFEILENPLENVDAGIDFGAEVETDEEPNGEPEF